MLKGKPEINFYTKGKLMWLIDDTSMNRKYDMLTLKEYIDIYNATPEESYRSYENYLTHANTNKEYKYNDWRLPTIKELKTLEYKGYWIFKYFTSSNHRNNDISINKDIFYDIRDNSDAHYWASDKGKITKDGKKTFGAVGFAHKRFKEYHLSGGASDGRGGAGVVGFPSLKSRGGEGTSSGKSIYTRDKHIRLVRDIKEN